MTTRPLIGCDTKRKGDASEALALWKLAEVGLTVLVPWGDNARFDLVAVINHTFLRIQCKTGRLRAGCVIFRTFGVGRDGKCYRYIAGEFDYYAVRCLETGELYLVPFGEAGTSTQPQLRVEPPRPNSTGGRQVARIRWASRYAADVVIESWLRTGGEFDPRWSPPVLEPTHRWHPNRQRTLALP
jgi:hypothetical protein